MKVPVDFWVILISPTLPSKVIFLCVIWCFYFCKPSPLSAAVNTVLTLVNGNYVTFSTSSIFIGRLWLRIDFSSLDWQRKSYENNKGINICTTRSIHLMVTIFLIGITTCSSHIKLMGQLAWKLNQGRLSITSAATDLGIVRRAHATCLGAIRI